MNRLTPLLEELTNARTDNSGNATAHIPGRRGLPIAETGFHVTLIAYFLALLRAFFESCPDVYVGANMLTYYQAGDPTMNKQRLHGH